MRNTKEKQNFITMKTQRRLKQVLQTGPDLPLVHATLGRGNNPPSLKTSYIAFMSPKVRTSTASQRGHL